jgi:hypothetical protein
MPPADPPRAAPAALPAACLNCGQPFGEPRPRYCPACSQETNLKPPTVQEFLQQFGGAYFATEGAFWRTLRLLLFRPGELTAQYLAGRRKHYVLPLRLFLSVTLVMLLAMRVSGSINFSAVEDPEVAQALPEKPHSVQLELGFGSAGLDEGVFYCEGLPQWLCRRIQARLDVGTRTMVQQMHMVSDRLASNASATLLLLMPAFSFGLWLLYRNRGLRYTEHLVFALHLHAFWVIVIAFMMTGIDFINVLGLLAIPVYGLLAMHRVYGGRWWALLLRALVLGVAHLLVVGLTVVGAALIALLL